MTRSGLKLESGFLFLETMVSMVLFSSISLALLIGFVALERNLAATTDFAINHTAAVRVADYLALDLRRALSVTTSQNNTTISIPTYYDVNGTPQMPTLDGKGGVFYGSDRSSAVVIHYYLAGNTIYRQQDTTTAVPIADNVNKFNFAVTDLGKVVTTQITFNPIFVSKGASADATAATGVYNTTLLRNSRTDITSSVYNATQ